MAEEPAVFFVFFSTWPKDEESDLCGQFHFFFLVFLLFSVDLCSYRVLRQILGFNGALLGFTEF